MGGVSLVGPLIENQAVTKQIVAAFSFALNTNLNTTPRQLISGATDSRHVHAACVQTMAGEKEKLRRIIFFCPAYIYRFRFVRAYIKPEPNQNHGIGKINTSTIFEPKKCCDLSENFAGSPHYELI